MRDKYAPRRTAPHHTELDIAPLRARQWLYSIQSRRARALWSHAAPRRAAPRQPGQMFSLISRRALPRLRLGEHVATKTGFERTLKTLKGLLKAL